jgi:hypothetical protein
MRGRTVRTLKARTRFLDELARTGNVERSAAAAGFSRSVSYEWREQDEAFRREWDSAVQAVMDQIEAKLIEQARTDDSPAGVTSRIFLRSLARRGGLQSGDADPARCDAAGAGTATDGDERDADDRMIEGKAMVANGVSITADFVHVIAMPWNRRNRSPHAPTFDPLQADDGDEIAIEPCPQDGSGQTMPMPNGVLCVHHTEPHEHLPVSLLTDGKLVPPAAATDLWARIRAHNRWLAEAYPALAPERPVGYADHVEALDDPPAEFEDGNGSGDDEPPEEGRADLVGHNTSDNAMLHELRCVAELLRRLVMAMTIAQTAPHAETSW